MFESRTVTAHLARGAIGFGAIAGAFALGPSHPWIVIAAIPLVLLALRGCPMCWMMGLVETLQARARGRPDRSCRDGRCGPSRHGPADRAEDGRAG